MMIDEIQADIAGLVSDARKFISDLECAESCGDKDDLLANIEQAAAAIASMKSELSAICKRAKRIEA